MRSTLQAVLSVRFLSVAAGALLLMGCNTWQGLGKDIGSTGDSMAGEGRYVMTVSATPDLVTEAAREALAQLEMTEIESSGDRSEGTVTAKTVRQDGVRIEIQQSGESDSTVTIYTHGDNADTVGSEIQEQIHLNLR